jgi:hypothetical protein
MDTTIIRPATAAGKPKLRRTREEISRRLAEIDDAIAAIRAQIAAADLTRQASGTPIDPRWFHRAKTALRHLRRERADLRMASAAPPSRRESLKDCLIAVLRERHDQAGWTRVMDEAHRRLDREAP